MSNHATYSPSASERWLNCPGSVDLTNEIQPAQSEHNEYTASGTVIHALGEMLLRAVFKEDTDWRPIIDHALTETWGYYAELPPEFANLPMTSDMVDQAEVYLHHARTLIDDDDEVYIEKRVGNTDSLVFGTADLVAWNKDRLLICDLKTGSGHMVWPDSNPQLLTYAWLALTEPDDKPVTLPTRIELAIIQPPDEENVLKVWDAPLDIVPEHGDRIIRAMDDTALQPGKWCRWCPVRAACPELHKMVTNAASKDLDGLTPEGWAEVLGMAAIMKDWASSVYERANQLAIENGLRIPGYKIVEKAGRTTWTSETAAAHALIEAGADKESIYNPAKLRTPNQVKKENKDLDVALVDSLVHTPMRGHILVTEKDKREEAVTGENLVTAAEQVAFFK